ncbi:tetratricopeptide repeat protein [Fluviispira vulneris]|uniref:tetratricopeptide repeat protein n=1 Tax=Fluviispira vulneris TaxID=2763012 RepID=UPI001645AF86|nr:tetratricopeptide repeat protein [Fluviispira vulneris]
MIKSFKVYMILIFIQIFTFSCVSKEENVESFQFGSSILNLPFQESILVYPDSTQPEQRMIFAEKFITPDVTKYLNSKEIENNNSKIQIDDSSQNNLKTPTIIEVIAFAFQDLKRGDSQKSVEKINNVLNILEKNRSKTLSEDLALSPYREAYLVLALSLLHDGNNSDAVAILEKLILASAFWAQPYIVLSDYYLEQGAFELAKIVALKGIDFAEPTHPSLYVSLARAYRGKKNLIQARQAINRGRILFPNNNELISWMGVIEFDEKNYLKGCQLLQQAFELDNSNSSLAHNYAVCLLQSNQLDQANKIMQIAIASNPSNPKLYYTNGIIEEARKHFFAAQKSWQTFLSLAKQDDANYKLIKFKLSQMSYLERSKEEE